MTGSENLTTATEQLQHQLRQAQKRIASLEVIQEVTRSLTSELNLSPLLHKILAAAVKVTDASAGSLLLMDEPANELRFAVVEGGGGPGLEGTRLAADQGIAGWVATNRQALIVDDVKQDDRYYRSIARAFKFKVTSLLCVPLLSHSRLIGVLQVVRSRERHYFNDDDQGLLTTFASEAAIAIENARLYEDLKQERDKIVAVEDEVRKHLARDLHDGPAQYIASVVLNLALVKELVDVAPQDAPPEIEQTMALAETALKQLRSLLFDLRPVILETQGLIPALELYTERLQDTEELNINLQAEQPFGRLSHTAEVAIFAIIQEAVNNAKKYAQASRLDVMLQPDLARDRLLVVIQDNGIGFDVEATQANYDARGSLGMLNMHERTQTVNGELKLISTAGQGTRVELLLPISENLLNTTTI